MFTIEQIREAHSRVKSGADFPKYIKDIKNLGVRAFETWVSDSHTQYYGADDFSTSSQPMYSAKVIADNCDPETFAERLRLHQQGGTDYVTFCDDCAATGVERWYADLNAMTCTYFSKSGQTVLEEKIPG